MLTSSGWLRAVDPRHNPYNPGAGLRPAALAGRNGDIESFEILADRAARSLPRRCDYWALTAPAADRDVAWDPDAVEFALDKSRGYPYFLQQFEKAVRDAAAIRLLGPRHG